jgi:ketosteroid isomerase-like protein
VSDLIEPPAARRPEEALEFVSQAVSDGDIEAALAQYEGSAVLARWPGRQADGDRDVRGGLTDLADLRLPLWVRVVGVLEAPGLALVICERRMAGIGPDGEHVRLDGHGCAVLRPQPDGAWRIAADAWDSGKGHVDSPREPKAPASPGLSFSPRTHPRGDEGATREGAASRGAGGEREDRAEPAGTARVGAEFPPEPPEIPLAPAGDAVPGEEMAGSLTTKACLSARNGTR